jgi:hypothetical protein
MTNKRWLVLCGTLAACGPSSIPIDDLGAKVKDALCSHAVRCGSFPDMATCLASTHIDEGQLVNDVKSGKITYDGQAAADCLDTLSSTSCSFSDQLFASEPQSCKDSIKGTVADGGPCFTSSDCVSGSCNTIGGCMGTCDPSRTIITANGNCSAPNTKCTDDSWCNGGTCTMRTPAGQPCMGLAECARGTLCVSGTCGRLPTAGETCNPGDIFGCDTPELFCNPTTMKCEAVVAVGASCASAQCVPYAQCDATMHCAEYAGAGDACMSSGDCLGDLDCDTTMHCALPADPMVCQ